MYSFDMTTEQKMLVDTVHRYAEEQLRTVYREAEESREIPEEAILTGWEIGLLPGSIEEDFGGFGEYSAITSALYLEELGWGDVAVSLHLLTPSLFATPDRPLRQQASRRRPICPSSAKRRPPKRPQPSSSRSTS